MKLGKIKKIAVPYDGSGCSNHAFKLALNLAQKYKARLILVTCVEKINGGLFGKEFSPNYLKAVEKYKEKILRKISKLETISKKMKVPFTSKIFVTDHTVEKIISFTRYNGIDIIVIGSHGKTGMSKLILGSVANGVTQRSNIPVLIVR